MRISDSGRYGLTLVAFTKALFGLRKFEMIEKWRLRRLTMSKRLISRNEFVGFSGSCRKTFEILAKYRKLSRFQADSIKQSTSGQNLFISNRRFSISGVFTTRKFGSKSGEIEKITIFTSSNKLISCHLALTKACRIRKV